MPLVASCSHTRLNAEAGRLIFLGSALWFAFLLKCMMSAILRHSFKGYKRF